MKRKNIIFTFSLITILILLIINLVKKETTFLTNITNNIRNSNYNGTSNFIKTGSDHDYISISKINLKQRLYSLGDSLNNVDYSVTYLETSNYPDFKNGNVILAAHSGNSKISYFEDLDHLMINDLVKIHYKSKDYHYKIKNIYEENRNGYININRNYQVNTLTLTTCHPKKSDKQLVLIGEMTS